MSPAALRIERAATAARLEAIDRELAAAGEALAQGVDEPSRPGPRSKKSARAALIAADPALVACDRGLADPGHIDVRVIEALEATETLGAAARKERAS